MEAAVEGEINVLITLPGGTEKLQVFEANTELTEIQSSIRASCLIDGGRLTNFDNVKNIKMGPVSSGNYKFIDSIYGSEDKKRRVNNGRIAEFKRLFLQQPINSVLLISFLALFVTFIIFNFFNDASGICIFDVSSLMRKDGSAVPYALQAQRKCIESGHEIAIFSSKMIDTKSDRKFY